MFKLSLFEWIRALQHSLQAWCFHYCNLDLSPINVFLVSSFPHPIFPPSPSLFYLPTFLRCLTMYSWLEPNLLSKSTKIVMFRGKNCLACIFCIEFLDKFFVFIGTQLILGCQPHSCLQSLLILHTLAYFENQKCKSQRL